MNEKCVCVCACVLFTLQKWESTILQLHNHAVQHWQHGRDVQQDQDNRLIKKITHTENKTKNKRQSTQSFVLCTVLIKNYSIL